ncbi:MAG: enoyl-CoA hydratase [Pseudomonadota bacterium]|nr:enoyl-CoA hydratase [Pseudomonadota bacterium]
MELNTEKMIIRTEDGVGWMIFNNPERRNALAHEMRLAMIEILRSYAEDDAIRAVVMAGNGGKAFVSGADISEFEERRSSPEAIAEFNEVGHQVDVAFEKLEKPLIAMIEGFCIGGGLATALKADMRYATPNSQFGIPAVKLGLGYEAGSVRMLADFVGPAYAAEILMTGRRFDAEEALRMGLINNIVTADKLEKTVMETARVIATNAPLTMCSMKANVRATRLDPEDRDEARLQELVDACFNSEDYIEGRRAFMEKRQPQWKGR